MKIVLAGGGTGGHLFPGIALAQALVRRDPTVEPWFLCTDRPIDERNLRRYGFPFQVLAGQRFRGLRRGGFAAVPELARGWHHAWTHVARLKPAVVVGLGGYGMVGPALAAAFRGIPLVLLEQNVVPGKAVRVCARFARKVCGQWDVTGLRFAGRPGRYRATGNPLREELKPIPRDEALRELGLAPDKRTLLVMGGSQGATGVDGIVLRHGGCLKDAAARVQAVHLTNAENEVSVRAHYAALGVDARVFPFVERMALPYSAADVALARAGGTAVAEMAAFGIPMILVPYPHAADQHQHSNALEAAKQKAGFCHPETDWNEAWFKNYVDTLLLDDRRREAFARNARSLARPGAAEAVVEEVLTLAAGARALRGVTP